MPTKYIQTKFGPRCIGNRLTQAEQTANAIYKYKKRFGLRNRSLTRSEKRAMGI